MKIRKFMKKVAKGVQEELGECYCIETKEILKNNDTTQHGIVVKRKGADVVPCVYVDELYLRFSADSITLEKVIKEIVRTYYEDDIPDFIDVKGFGEYENIRHKIRGKLINTKKNRKFLQDIPHRDFLDLSLVYKIDMGVDNTGAMSVCVRNSHLELWGIGEEALFEAVQEYMEHMDEIFFENVEDLLCRKLGEGIKEDIEGGLPLYVLSTKEQRYGAVCMTSRKIMEMVSDSFGVGFTIIPCSVHELLLLPDKGKRIRTKYLEGMIRKVNRTEVLPSEVLSGHAYHYSKESGEVEIVE